MGKVERAFEWQIEFCITPSMECMRKEARHSNSPCLHAGMFCMIVAVPPGEEMGVLSRCYLVPLKSFCHMAIHVAN